MLENGDITPPKPHPIALIIYVFLAVGIGFIIVGPLIGFMVSLGFYEGNFMELAEATQDPAAHPEIKIPLYIVQGFATFVGLIAGPTALLFIFRRSPVSFFRFRQADVIPFFITPVLVIIFMGVNSIFIEWNAGVHFPDFMKGFEEWAREKEDFAAGATEMLTSFDSTGEMLLALVVLAVLPAVGEELVFRGLIQKELTRAGANIHLAVWISAFLFSAIHMQFFGFVPRLLLGALFGYLYYWSGNLAIPVLAHFVNNGFAVIGIYFYRQGTLEYNVEDTEALPWTMVAFSMLVTAALIYYIRKYYQQQHAAGS